MRLHYRLPAGNLSLGIWDRTSWLVQLLLRKDATCIASTYRNVSVKEWVPALSAPAPGCLASPTIAEPCRDTIDGKLDPTQHLLVDAARSVLLQELDLDVVQRIQVREPVAYRAI